MNTAFNYLHKKTVSNVINVNNYCRSINRQYEKIIQEKDLKTIFN